MTQTDKPTLAEPEAPKKAPNRGIRKRVLGDGEGDYCIYEIAGSDSNLPKGSLLPIPTVPRFTATFLAVKWIKSESGDLLAGKQVMIVKACEILSLQITTKPTIVISCKPKITVTKPEVSNG